MSSSPKAIALNYVRKLHPMFGYAKSHSSPPVWTLRSHLHGWCHCDLNVASLSCCCLKVLEFPYDWMLLLNKHKQIRSAGSYLQCIVIRGEPDIQSDWLPQPGIRDQKNTLNNRIFPWHTLPNMKDSKIARAIDGWREDSWKLLVFTCDIFPS
jgi:hypothetical protein